MMIDVSHITNKGSGGGRLRFQITLSTYTCCSDCFCYHCFETERLPALLDRLPALLVGVSLGWLGVLGLIEILSLESLAWALSIGIFGVGSLAWDLRRWIFGLGSFGRDLWLRIISFASLAPWLPEKSWKIMENH